MSVEQEKAIPAELEVDNQDRVELAMDEEANNQTKALDNEAAHRPKLTDFRFLMILIGFGMAFVGSQVQPLIFAAIIPMVSADLDGSDLLIWFFSTPLIATGIISPFAGPLADLFGRKRITISGILSSMIGMVLSAATPNASGFIAGQVFAGMGIAIQELMAIAAIAEIVPTQYRGYYIALVVASFLPFAPASLYGELIAHTSWRYCACLIAIWNLITAALITFFYKPPPRPNSAGLTWIQKFKHIDFLGGCFMSGGIILFLVGFNWGGQKYPWHSVWVIAFLTIGLSMLVMFVAYEYFWAPYPMFPRRLWQHPRTFVALMLVVLLAGINYISILMFWVLEAVGVYNSNRTDLGIRTLPYGFCILAGALISAIMTSAFKGHLRSIMTFFCVMQATAIACMAAVDTHNINSVWAPLILGLIGVGGVLIPNQIIITVICPDDLIATATCLTVCLRGIGQVIGTSIFYTQFVSTLTVNTYNYVVPVAVDVGIYNSTILQNMMPTLLSTPWKEWAPTIVELDTPDKISMLHEAVVKAFKLSFSRVWHISIAFGVSAIIASVFIENLVKLMDGHIAVYYF